MCARADDRAFVLSEGIDDPPHEDRLRCVSVRRSVCGPYHRAIALCDPFHHRSHQRVRRETVAFGDQQHAGTKVFEGSHCCQQSGTLVERSPATSPVVGGAYFSVGSATAPEFVKRRLSIAKDVKLFFSPTAYGAFSEFDGMLVGYEEERGLKINEFLERRDRALRILWQDLGGREKEPPGGA